MSVLPVPVAIVDQHLALALARSPARSPCWPRPGRAGAAGSCGIARERRQLGVEVARRAAPRARPACGRPRPRASGSARGGRRGTRSPRRSSSTGTARRTRPGSVGCWLDARASSARPGSARPAGPSVSFLASTTPTTRPPVAEGVVGRAVERGQLRQGGRRRQLVQRRARRFRDRPPGLPELRVDTTPPRILLALHHGSAIVPARRQGQHPSPDSGFGPGERGARKRRMRVADERQDIAGAAPPCYRSFWIDWKPLLHYAPFAPH